MSRVDAQSALRPAERRFDQRAFVGHQRRQRLYLVLADRQGIADAALDRLHVFGMHAAIAGKGFDLAAQAHTEAHRVGRVADLDLLLQPGAQIHQPGGAVEHQVDRIAKARLRRCVHATPPGRPGAHGRRGPP